ncbi:c-type cytochrome [Wenzhouxiangella marina]|nr:cytochrome c [Wenzhouxiangella marina]MBB6086530.1 cytochrome c553 [Wenzhouxiangella marina]
MTLATVFASLLLANAAWASGNPSRGQELAGQVCQSCHGIDGNTVLSPEYPRLAGQHRDYLVVALKAYRSGARNNAIMASFAQNLSDQDIEDLAAWFSRQDGLVELEVD